MCHWLIDLTLILVLVLILAFALSQSTNTKPFNIPKMNIQSGCLRCFALPFTQSLGSKCLVSGIVHPKRERLLMSLARQATLFVQRII